LESFLGKKTKGKTNEMEKCGRVGGRHPRCCNGTNGNGKEEEELLGKTHDLDDVF
jgi:hypothetical protein